VWPQLATTQTRSNLYRYGIDGRGCYRFGRARMIFRHEIRCHDVKFVLVTNLECSSSANAIGYFFQTAATIMHSHRLPCYHSLSPTSPRTPSSQQPLGLSTQPTPSYQRLLAHSTPSSQQLPSLSTQPTPSYQQPCQSMPFSSQQPFTHSLDLSSP
jgi:hypothetical protein